MADPVVEAIIFRSRDHEFLSSYHGDICDVLSRSEETLIVFAGVLYVKGIIDVHTKNSVIRNKGSEGAEILMDRVEIKVKQNPRHLKRVLRMMKKLEDLETISRKIGSKISRIQKRRSHPLLNSDMSYEEESSSVASLGKAVKPTVSELCFELKGLVEWENTVIHLPAMSSTEVQIVKRNESKVDQQKQGAFDTWLRRCPGASWSHVRDALHKAGEYTMEKKIATNHSISLMFSEDPSRRRHDDTAITCPRTAVRTGSVTVAATRDPHGSHYFNPVVSRYNPTQDPLLDLSSVVSIAMTLRERFEQLLQLVLRVIASVDIFLLRLKLNSRISFEKQNSPEIQKHLRDLESSQTPQAVLNFLIHTNLVGYLNYELLKCFTDVVPNSELVSQLQQYEAEHDNFLKSTDFNTLIHVFQKHEELRPASAVGLPKFALHLESQWEGRSTYSWKELLYNQFNWPPHVHVSSIIRNCIIIEYSVLPFFAPAVVRDLTDPLVLAILKRQGVTVKLSQELIEMGKDLIGPRNDQLHCAVITGTVADVEKLIEGGARVEEIDEEGYTPLHLAAMCGKTDIVEALIKRGANVHMKTQDKFLHVYIERLYTSLHLAAESGKTDTVEALIKHGAKVHERTTWMKYTSLHLAAKSGKTDTVESLIKHGADVHGKTALEWYTSLHLAAQSGKTDTVEALIKHGADVHGKTAQEGYTSLHLAAQSGKTDTVEALIKHGADVHGKTAQEGYTSLHLAAQSGKTDTVEALIKHGADVHGKTRWVKYTSLHLAAQSGKTDTVEALIKHGADVHDKATLREYTSLHLAYKSGETDEVEALIEHGADVHRKISEEYTSLHLAAQSGKTDTVEALIKHGADVHGKTCWRGYTSLHLAAQSGKTDTVEALIKHGSSIYLENKDGVTPFHCAVQGCSSDTVERLIKCHKVDVLKDTKDGRSVLHFAASNRNHPEVAELLVTKYSVDVNKQDKDGWTALHLALPQGGNAKIVTVLAQHGASVQEDKDGRTILHLAVENRECDPKVVEFLITKYSLDVNKQDKSGASPLLCLVKSRGVHHFYRGSSEVVEKLLKFGADPNLKDKSGASPLLCVVKSIPFYRGSSEVVEKLLKFGADPNLKDEHDITPLGYIDRWSQEREMPSSYMHDEYNPMETEKIKHLLLSNGAKSEPDYETHHLEKMKIPHVESQKSTPVLKVSETGDPSEPDPLSEVF